jgi:hypothetical protein
MSPVGKTPLQSTKKVNFSPAWVALWICVGSGSSPCFSSENGEPQPASPVPPSIVTLLKPASWKKLTQDREIIVNASLKVPEREKPDAKKYSFFAAMHTSSSLTKTREILTDYQVYSKLIPYIDRAEYSSQNHTLFINGGIWRYYLSSSILFKEVSDRWIHYQVVSGSFVGMIGDIFFEPWVVPGVGEKGTLVYFRGEQVGKKWPPQFVIEQGAEIVFGFTAHRMRSYIESQKKVEKGVGGHEQRNGQEVPQPRTHLSR